jgi:hypothetical protein
LAERKAKGMCKKDPLQYTADLIVTKNKVIKNRYNNERNPEEVLRSMDLRDDDVLVVMNKNVFVELGGILED